MSRYRNEDPFEREPLDSSYSPYESPSRTPAASANAYSNSTPGSPYFDGPPRYPNPAAASYDYSRQQGVLDNDPYDHSTHRFAADPPSYGGGPVPPRHGNSSYSRAATTSPERAANRRGVGDAASGGMAGIAYTVAERNARESGLEAMRGSEAIPPPPSHTQFPDVPRQTLAPQAGSGGYRYDHSAYGASHSASSSSPNVNSSSDSYADDPYQSYSGNMRNVDTRLGFVDPNDIEDDGDDGLNYPRNSQRNSMLSSSNSDRGTRSAIGAAAAVGGATAAGGVVGSALGRNGYRGPVSEFDHTTGHEKSSAWLGKKDDGKRRRNRLLVIGLILFVVVGALVGGIVGGLVDNSDDNKDADKSSSDGDGQSAEDDTKENGDLSLHSSEIQDLLNNSDLHKVFPGMDYTPYNTQYPDCVENPPSQNNITRDVAVLGQLTNKIRLYGTDCNQTQMVLHALDKLEMSDDIKVWMGVWQDGNKTTNARQLEQMWDILDDYGDEPFEGVIVANEILFREEMTITTLGSLLDDVRTNLSKKGLDLPVATSDLGDDWTQALADDSDYLMANIHPFFAGVEASKAADWTYSFWENQDGSYFKSDDSKNIISETGWPSGGGTDCGGADSCDKGSVAGIDEMNRFMDDWVCQALSNGTTYFWFEAFDEPWKVRYNEKGKEWEDKWGLMTDDRKLKDGVKIPDCGGKTVS